jgi:dimethylhistidine N-methyltransferase
MTVRPSTLTAHSANTDDARAAFAVDVQYYLSQDPKQLPSCHLYDDLGSCLFEAICRLPWYRITRAETRLLGTHGGEILAAAGPLDSIVELGSGSGEKLATILAVRRPPAPLTLHLIDLSGTALSLSERTLSPLEDVRIVLHQAAYEAGLEELRAQDDSLGRALVLFLGSNIGNFDPPGAEEFLRTIRSALAPGDSLLLGADLVKPAAVLQLAYDDPLGVTAAFNRNLLVRINRELGGNFDLDAFAHSARWNAHESRVEMHLVSLRRQAVSITAADLDFTIDEGESIWTESSYKYEAHQIVDAAERTGFQRKAQWVDANDGFALTLVTAA